MNIPELTRGQQPTKPLTPSEVTMAFPPPDSLSNLWSYEQTGPYPYVGDTQIGVSYGGLTGILPAAVAGPSLIGTTRTPCVLIQVHAPISTKTVSFVCEREGAIPRVPAPNTLDANNVLIGMSIGNPAKSLKPDGITVVWRITGQYTFAQVQPFAIGDNLASATTPAVGVAPSAFALPGTAFDQSLLG